MFDKKEALKKLNSEQYEVTQHAATEMPFSGKSLYFPDRKSVV